MGERLQAHLSLRWGDVILSSTSAPAARGFVLGRGGDWPLPAEILGAERFELLRSREGGVVLAVPPGATAWLDGQTSPFRPWAEHPLRAGGRGRVDLGSSVSVEIQVGPAPERLKGFVVGASALGHQALSAAFHAGVLALLALMVPPVDAGTMDAEQYADHVAYLAHALDGASPESASTGPTPDDAQVPQGAEDAQARSQPGAPGRREAPREHSVRARATRGPVAPRDDPDAARAATLRHAASFGMIGLLPAGASSTVGWQGGARVSPPTQGEPPDGMSSSGLFLPSDSGLVGGSDGAIIGFSIFDAVARPKGMVGSGMSSSGRLGGSHRVRAPRVCECGGVHVNGRLPPETIQRVIHQSFGRFRGCYEEALKPNPTFGARVETRFVIGQDGGVAFARSEGPQPLAACVQAAFEGLTFPQPSGGTVVVEYPLLLQPDDVPSPTAHVER